MPFQGWLAEVSPGRFRSVWNGSDPYRVGGSAREQRRNRLRILNWKVEHSEVYRGDLLEAVSIARSIEYPLTSVDVRKAA